MFEIELCRVCLADSIRMYPIERTRYHEVFEWHTGNTLDMNDELPSSVCYLCNAVLNKLYEFLKNMIDTELYLKEILRTKSKLTYESVEELKKEMISKPYNLSKIWLRNSNYIALDAYKGHRPPKALQRYFDYPPFMIEYHKPYQHMKLDDIPEEQEPKEVNGEQPDPKEPAIEEKMEVETDQIKEAKSEEIKDKETLQQKSKLPEESKSPHRVQKKSSVQSEDKSQENNDQPKLPQEKFKNQPELIYNIYEDSETTEYEFPNDDVTVIEYNNSTKQSNHKSESNYSNEKTKIPDPIDSFLISAQKYRRPEETANSSNENVTKDHHPYLKFIERIATAEKQQEKKVKSPKTEKYHIPYLQFIEERIASEHKPLEKRVKTLEPLKHHHPSLQEQCIPTEEKLPKKILKRSVQKAKTPDPEKYQNQNLSLIEHLPVEETEPEHTFIQMEINKTIDTAYHNHTHDTPSVQQISTDNTAMQVKDCNLYKKSVKEAPFILSNELIDITKLTPIMKIPYKRITPVQKIIKLTKANEPIKIMATSESKTYIHSYVHFVKEISDVEKGLHQESVCSKDTVKRKFKNKTSRKIDPITVQEKLTENIDIESKISNYYCLDNQKKCLNHRASILRKSHHPNRYKRGIKELANKLKNRAAFYRKEFLNSQNTDLNVKTVLKKNAITKPAPNDEAQPGISKFQEEKSKKKLPHVYKNKKLRRIVVYPTKSDLTDKVSNEPKDQNQGEKNQYNNQVTLKDQAATILEDDINQIWSDQEDNTVDSAVDHAIKVLDKSLKDEVGDIILLTEDNQEHNMPNDQNKDTITDKNDPSLQLQDVCIIIGPEDNNEPKDQNEPSFVVQNVFSLNDQGLEDEHLIEKEQYDQIIMLANQDDLDDDEDDVNVAVKIESVNEELQGFVEENNDDKNVLSETEIYNEDIMDLNYGSGDLIQHSDIKMEVKNNMQIDDEVQEYDPNLQERVTVNENSPRSNRDSPSNNENREFEPNYDVTQGLSVQEHYAIRKISQISKIPIVQLERLPIGLIKRNKTVNNGSGNQNAKHFSAYKNTSKPMYSCPDCDFTTTIRKQMFKHQNVHDKNKRFICNVCQHRFISQYHLSAHEVIHDHTKHYCAYCDFKTTSKLILDRHQDEHNNLNGFKCQWCKRRFSTPSLRSKHMCRKKKKLRKCYVCNKEFTNEAGYLRHLDKHAQVVPISYKCFICYKNFDTKEKYLNHYKKHGSEDSKIKRYTCKWCHRKFNAKSNCNKHMKLHEKYGEKISLETEDNQEINKTGIELNQEINETGMELHEEKNEKEDDRFVCGLCLQLFDTEIELGKHAVEHIL